MPTLNETLAILRNIEANGYGTYTVAEMIRLLENMSKGMGDHDVTLVL